MFDQDDDVEDEGIGFLGLGQPFAPFSPFGGGRRRPGPFGGLFTLPGMKTTAPSATPGLRPKCPPGKYWNERFQVCADPVPVGEVVLGVDPRAAVWRLQAQTKQCPQCPSKIVATETSPGLVTAEQAWQMAAALKAKTKAQWIIASRQRKQGEPKPGEWFSVWIPTATLAHLKNLEANAGY